MNYPNARLPPNPFRLKSGATQHRRTADWKAHQDRRGTCTRGGRDKEKLSCPLPPAINVAESLVIHP
ncbi:MAG: hypothetical protein AB4063_01190 [Crocosphaera sp.]